MEIASGLLSSACQLACVPVCQQLNYIRKLRENEETMQSEWRTLSSQKNDICTNMNTGKVQYGKTPKERVTNWLKKVEEIEKRVNNLGPAVAHHMCCKGFCPNYYSRLKRSKKIVGIRRKVQDLLEEGKPFAEGENLFIDSLPEPAILPATTLHGTSAEMKKEEILQCIMDPEVGKIGVYGMGGVGKTTIMRQIYNQLQEKLQEEKLQEKKGDFNIVMWVTVSSVFELAKLQETIAKQLGCPLSSDETSRAMELSQALRRRGNFVIILDDIWGGVSLQTVGIPEDGNGSKIVWTTRSKAVCHSMESNREIEVEGLTPEEAWSLFKGKVGADDVIMSTEIQLIVKQVAEECGRLPLALITMGCALRKEKQLPVWRNALHQLKTSRADQIKGMSKDVFGSLKFSYDRLISDTIRACFLYCALFPEDYEIKVDQLIEYWMVEGLIDEEGSIQTEKDKGHAYLKELKDACMIQSVGDDDECVRMHDLIRDLAINITKKQFMVKARLQLKESPKEEEWVESLQRVSLMGNFIEAFKGQPNCPQLSTLLLHNDPIEGTLLEQPVTFSDTFFKHMHNLKVLDLSWTRIKSLPDSLSDLVNLHALILMGCDKLECLPSLAKLHELRQLTLRHLISLKELPHGLENLIKLRHLDISCQNRDGEWRSFPSEVLLKMPCLEILSLSILSMLGSRWRLSYRSNANAEDNSTIGEIIIRLKKLTKFSADFTDVLAFNSFTNKARESEFWRNLDYFHFTLLYYESMEKVILPVSASTVKIKHCNFIQLSDIFHSFEGLCKNLRKLDISKCHELKYLIPNDLLVNNLQNLEEITIQDCVEIKGIISCKTSATMARLPKLKTLKLLNLPSLTSIYHGKLVCDSLCVMEIRYCDNLKELPFLINKERPLSMRIVAKEEWWERLEWEDAQLKELLQPFLDSRPSNFEPDYLREAIDFELGLMTSVPTIKIGKVDLDELDD